MKLEHWHDGLKAESHWHLVISDMDLMKVKTTDFDRRLYEECERSVDISDKLLALENMVSRIEIEAKK